MCYVGQHLVFSQAEEVINNLTGSDFNAKQIERVCHQYGQCLLDAELDKIADDAYEPSSLGDRDQLCYVSVDGSMYLTREDGWKEIKLGRIYKERDCTQSSDERGLIMESQYVAHLGSSKEFLEKMDYHIEHLSNKVFIADGAKWIWNWVEDNYGDSIQIVDYFHAKEHLCDFAKIYFKDQTERDRWIDKQSKTMLDKGITPVIAAISVLSDTAEKQQLLQYYTQNEHRMQYHVFKAKGLQIGSGAIESAHKDVLQHRLKLSGQRWTTQGLRQMAQLGVVYKSGKWENVRQLCQNAA